MHRRQFLATALATASASGVTFHHSAQGQSPEAHSARLRQLLDRMYAYRLDSSPEGATDLGLDHGTRAAAKARWDNRSLEADQAFLAAQSAFRDQLATIDPKGLTASEAIYREILLNHLELALAGAARHRFGVRGEPAPFMLNQFSGVHPYVISHLDGAHASLFDFLITKHAISSAADVEAYVARLEALPAVFDQELARARHDLDSGVIPPGFILQKALRQLRALAETPSSEAYSIRHLAASVRDLGLSDALLVRGGRAFDEQIRPALGRQIKLLDAKQKQAGEQPGVWRLPEGEAYYAHAVQLCTSTNLTAAEIHRIGIEQVAEISAQLDPLLRAQGYAGGSVGARLVKLAAEPRFSFPDNAQGKQDILETFRQLSTDITRRLPSMFGVLPARALRIEPVPAALEASAARGYYQNGSLNGTRPGVYFANLRSTAEWSRFYLATFAYHEGAPGHHLQMSLALERDDLPPVLKLLQLPGFTEGWALYAEQLADEMGIYDGNPVGRIGYLQSMLFRAARLVADTGVHHKRWQRHEAIRYLQETVGESESRASSEIDRYAVWPGQALSYKVGHHQWQTLRSRMQALQAERFSLSAFHDAALRCGPMPFGVLQRSVQHWLNGR